MRRVEKHVEGNWEATEMKHLKPGDIFRMFEPDGSPVIQETKNDRLDQWMAKSRPFKNINGIWEIGVF